MSIHPTAIIEEGVQLGAGCVVHAYAIIRKHSVLGDGVVVHSFAVLGGDPQYLKFDPATVSGVRIGAGTVIREHVTVNRSIHDGKATIVGARCFLMAASHVGHDCELADDVVLANSVLLAGHVTVGGFTFVGGGAAIHQFCRIGEGAMIGGVARITRDIPPFLLVAERDEVSGLNLVGLKRRGHGRDTILEIKEAFRAVYFTPGNIRKVARAALDSGTFKTPEAGRFLAFFTEGKRSFVQMRRQPAAGDDDGG